MTAGNGSMHNDGDGIGTLVRLASQRPPVPEEHIARAREAARSVWRQKVRRRSLGRYFWAGAALAAAASIILFVSYSLPPAGRATRAGLGGCGPIEVVAGEARIQEPAGAALSRERALVAEAMVPLDSVISTSATRRAAIRLPSGHSLRLDFSTQVRLAGADTLHLERGALYVASPSGVLSARPLTIETSLGLIQEIGTQFEVRLADSAVIVRVREGSVVLSHETGRREAAAGTELTLAAAGSVSVRQIRTYGAEWDWVSGITPMLNLDGRTARTFLDWVAREQGFKLAFADARLEEASSAIHVAGDLEGMTFTQALDAVLPSCGLGYRLEEGVLRLEAAPWASSSPQSP